MPKAFTVAAFVLVAMSAGAENWPGFRGGSANGLSSSSAPTTWDVAKGTNVVWKTPVPGIALSSPIVWEDRIYLTTAIPQAPPRGNNFRTGHVWKLFAIERATGKILWERVTHEGVPHMNRHPHSSYANATPATDGQYIVSVFGTDAVTCHDKNGNLVWKKTLQLSSPREGFHFGTSPVVVEGLAVFQDDRDRDSYVAAYRLSDGQEVWKVVREDGHSQATPAVVWIGGQNRRPLIVLSAEKFLRALEARTGAEVWRLQTNAPASSSPVTRDDVVVLSSGGSEKPVYALRAASHGDISLASSQDNNAGVIWRTERGGTHIPTPLVFGNQVLVLNDGGVLAAYNIHNGRRMFQQRVGSGEFSASPVAAGDKVYIFSNDGDATVVRVAPQFEIIARNSMGEPMKATPAIADGTLYVRTAGHLIALRESSAAQR